MKKELIVISGLGEGQTGLSAFDSALWDAGISNYNLIRLSSIIPKNSKLKIKKIDWNKKEIGNKLYVVLSESLQDKKGKDAWSGIGWIQAKDGSGVLMEHSGESKKEVEALIIKSLEDAKKTRGGGYSKPKMKIIGTKCLDKPVSSVVAVVFKSEVWNNKA